MRLGLKISGITLGLLLSVLCIGGATSANAAGTKDTSLHFTAKNIKGTMNMSWLKKDGYNYEVLCSKNNSNYNKINNDFKVIPGTIYKFKITEYLNNSITLESTNTTLVRPEAPEIIYSKKCQAVKINYKRPKGNVTGFVFFKSTDEKKYTRFKAIPNSKNGSFLYPVSGNKKTYFKAYTYVKIGGRNYYSKPVIFNTKVITKIPVIKELKPVGINRIQLKWNNMGTYDGIEISYRNKGEKNYHVVCKSKINSTSTVKSLKTSLNRDYRIRFYKMVNNKKSYTEYSAAKSYVARRKLNVKYLSQLPNMPTGCEITALTTVLNYEGFNVSKETMADKYLETSVIGTKSFYDAFVGSPYDAHSYGCYSPVILKAANKYLTAIGSSKRAYSLNNSELFDLFRYVESGHPVVIWNSSHMNESPTYSTTWYIGGKTYRWLRGEHCMALIGYDLSKNVVIVSDPLQGIMEYDLKTFNQRYIDFFKQAIVVK